MDEVGFFVVGRLLTEGNFGELFFGIVVLLAFFVEPALFVGHKLQRAYVDRLLSYWVQRYLEPSVVSVLIHSVR